MITSPIQLVFLLVVVGCVANTASATQSAEDRVKRCMRSTNNRRQLIIDTDTDVDDLWAIDYLINVTLRHISRLCFYLWSFRVKVPTIDILAIDTVGDAFQVNQISILVSHSSSFLQRIFLFGLQRSSTPGFSWLCESNSSCLWTEVGLGSSLQECVLILSLSSSPSLASGYVLSDSLLGPIDSYLTAPTCLNQSAADIFIQPSPFEAVELIKLILKYASEPVDILVLGTMTNIAAAITEDRSIIPKIGTLYFSGSLFARLCIEHFVLSLFL